MTIIAMLQGVGGLKVDGRAEIEVQYSINVDRTASVMSADGHLGGDTIALFEKMKAPFATLRLSNGDEITVVLTELAADGARIKINGTIPGY